LTVESDLNLVQLNHLGYRLSMLACHSIKAYWNTNLTGKKTHSGYLLTRTPKLILVCTVRLTLHESYIYIFAVFGAPYHNIIAVIS
jgi:hypothetical protein